MKPPIVSLALVTHKTVETTHRMDTGWVGQPRIVHVFDVSARASI